MIISYEQIQFGCIAYIVTWMIAPPLAYGSIYRIFAVAAAGIWILLQNSTIKDEINYNAYRSLSYYKICVCIYFTIHVLCDIIFDKETLWGAVYGNIAMVILLFAGYIAGIYCVQNRYEDLKRILFLVIALTVVFSITALVRSEDLYYATRDAGGNSAEMRNTAVIAAHHGVGGFGFFACTAVLAPLCLWLSKFYASYKKIGLIAAFVIIEAGVFSAGYTLALLISFMGICVCLIHQTKSVVAKMLVVTVAFLIVLNWSNFVTWLYDFLQTLASGSMYANKVEDIFSFLIGGESTGTFSSRKERYMLSLNSIFKYPLMGSYILNGTNSIGYHSSILDSFAAYGWIVGGMWFYIISIFPCKLINGYDRKKLRVFLFVLLTSTAMFNSSTLMMGGFYLIAPAIGFVEECSIEYKDTWEE